MRKRIINGVSLLPLLISFFSLSTTILKSQSIQPTPEESPIKVSTVLLNVPLIVTDKDGRSVPGLKKEDFHVIKDNVEQKIEYFSDAEMPLTVAILLDTTGSVGSELGNIKHASKAFIKQMDAADNGLIISFDEEVRILQKLTTDHKRLEEGVSSAVGISGGTGLMNEAILRVINKEFSGIKGRKAIIVLTDAGEINPKSETNVLDALIAGDTVVYSIYYQGSWNWPRNAKSLPTSQVAELRGAKFLNSMAIATGGRFIVAEGNFMEQFQTIADELKKMYVIGFYPNDGNSNEIHINPNRKDINVRMKRTIRVAPPIEKVQANPKRGNPHVQSFPCLDLTMMAQI